MGYGYGMTTTAAQQTEYANGYAAAQAAQKILDGQVAAGALPAIVLRDLAARSILRVNAIDPTWEQIGSSDAWSDWQQAQRRTARRAAQVRHFAGRQ
jgi:hypothetical protein